MNKRIIFFASMLFLVFNSYAQVQVNLNVSSNPTPELFEWTNRADLAILTVTNSNRDLVGTDYKIKVRVLLDNELVIETNNSVITQKLEFGSQTFLADEIIPYDAVVFLKNNFKNKMIQTGLLPAGFYSFCVSLIDNNGRTISIPTEICRSMIITDYQLPELLFPIDNYKINAELAPSILFNWSPVSPQPLAELGVKYIIAITEIQQGQSVSQAFHVNYPIVEEEIIGTTQFNWPLDIDLPTETTKYVWSIKPVTLNDNPYKSGVNGFSYIETFTLIISELNLDKTDNEEVVEEETLEKDALKVEILKDEIKPELLEKTIPIIYKNLQSLTKEYQTYDTDNISIRNQNLRDALLKETAQKIAYFKLQNQLKKGAMTKRENRIQKKKL